MPGPAVLSRCSAPRSGGGRRGGEGLAHVAVVSRHISGRTKALCGGSHTLVTLHSTPPPPLLQRLESTHALCHLILPEDEDGGARQRRPYIVVVSGQDGRPAAQTLPRPRLALSTRRRLPAVLTCARACCRYPALHTDQRTVCVCTTRSLVRGSRTVHTHTHTPLRDEVE